jgi:hypothetical protein
VLAGEPDARDFDVVGDVVRRAGTVGALDIVVVTRQEPLVVEMQCLLGAVGGEVARPDDAQPPPALAGLIPRLRLTRRESGHRERERLRQAGPHRCIHEVRELNGVPRGLGRVPGE